LYLYILIKIDLNHTRGKKLLEIPITSAFEFFKIAHKLKKDRNHSSEIEFFRGHSDKGWKLLPSIYRKYMLDFEEDLINEFMRRRPNEFSDSDGMFNIVAKMQHYGLHTRLLDVTENPAIALYFACCDNFDKDGEIFMFQRSLDEIPSNAVLNIIAEFYIRNKNSGGNYEIKDYYESVVNNYRKEDVKTAFYYITNGYYCFSRPKIISERILRQSGSIMLFANEVCPKENCKNEKCIHKEADKCKKGTVGTSISERVTNLWVKRGFIDYTNPHIINEQNRYRYIIKAGSKKEILSELNTVGINKAYLFPDLENEGLDIMQDYYSRVNN
jgi:hypothetical protein